MHHYYPKKLVHFTIYVEWSEFLPNEQTAVTELTAVLSYWLWVKSQRFVPHVSISFFQHKGSSLTQGKFSCTGRKCYQPAEQVLWDPALVFLKKKNLTPLIVGSYGLLEKDMEIPHH